MDPKSISKFPVLVAIGSLTLTACVNPAFVLSEEVRQGNLWIAANLSTEETAIVRQMAERIAVVTKDAVDADKFSGPVVW